MQNLLSSEKRTLDHWATVQFFFSTAQVRCFWHCLCGQEEERVESRHGWTAHQKASLKKPLSPRSLPGAEGIVFCCYRARTSAMQPSAVTVEKIKHKHSRKESNFSSSVPHECPASVQPATRVYQPLATRAEAWQAIPGVSDWVMGIIKRGYLLQFARRPPRFQRRGLHLGAGREHSRSTLRGDDVAGKRSHRNGPASSERVRLLQPLLLLVPKKDGGLRPILDLRRLNHALMRRPFRMITLKQIPSQIRTGDWFFSLNLKDAYFHIQIAPHHRRFLRFAFKGVAYQYAVLPFGLSLPPVLYQVHGRGSFPLWDRWESAFSTTLDDWLILAQSEVELLSHRTLILSHLERLGLRVNFAKKRTVSQPTSIVPGYSSGLSSHESGDSARTRSGHSETRGHLQERHRSPTQSVSENAGPHGRSIGSVTAGPAPHAPPSTLVENHGFHTTHGVTDACISGWPPGRTHDGWRRAWPWGWSTAGKLSRQTPPTQVGGRCAKANRPSAIGRMAEKGFHINSLEMLAVCRACQFFLLDPIGRHVLIRSDNMSVVSYINHQGGVSSKRLFYSGRAAFWMGSAQPALAEGSTPAGQTEPRSGYVISEQCPLRGVGLLHPQVVQKIWKTFGKAEEVDLFASKDTSHCPTYSKDRDALAHDWPNLLLYAFPPIALLPQVVRRVREQGHKVLLVAPLWRNQPWLSELTRLLTAAPWPVPLRRDLLSQANRTIWHPRPELWALYIWPLTGAYWPPRASVKHHFWG